MINVSLRLIHLRKAFQGGSRTENRKSGGRRLSSVVHITNHIKIEPGAGGDQRAYNRNNETRYNSAD